MELKGKKPEANILKYEYMLENISIERFYTMCFQASI